LDKKVAMTFEYIFYEQIKDGKVSSKRVEGASEANMLSLIYDLVGLLVYVRSESVEERIHMNIYAGTSLLCRFGEDITDIQYIDLLELLLKANLRNPKLEDSLVLAIKSAKYRSLALETLAEKANAPNTARKLARRALKARKDVQPEDTNQMGAIFFNIKLLKYLSAAQTKKLTSSIFKEILETIKDKSDFTINATFKIDALIAIIPYLSKLLRKKLMEVVEEPELHFDKASIYANLLACVEDKEKENLISLCCDLFTKIGGKSDINKYRLIKGLIDFGLQ
jgi:ribosome biogenesis SPOUT family RNA methylase Rps3